MDGGNQSVAHRLLPLQAMLARTERVINRARDDRVHRCALPTLPNHAIPAGVRDEISPCAAVGVHQLTAPANGGNAIIRTNRVTITARIGYHTHAVRLPRCRPARRASRRRPGTYGPSLPNPQPERQARMTCNRVPTASTPFAHRWKRRPVRIRSYGGPVLARSQCGQQPRPRRLHPVPLAAGSSSAHRPLCAPSCIRCTVG